MEAPLSSLRHHGDYNVGALSFSPRELAAEIKRHIPGFEVRYDLDCRQAIADSWPESVDVSASRDDWGWSTDYDLPAMVEDMIEVLGARHREGDL